MKKLMIAALLLIPSVASARTIRQSLATRVAPDTYALSTGEEVRTVACTETARDQWAVLDINGVESVLHFLDASGEVEETCRVATTTHARKPAQIAVGTRRSR